MNLTPPKPNAPQDEIVLFTLQCKQFLELIGSKFAQIGDTRINLHVWGGMLEN